MINRVNKSLSLLCNFSLIEVNPCYTSQIDNIIFGDEHTPDMIAASIEIGRRGYKKFEKNWFYPDFRKSLNLMNEQWKQTTSSVSAEGWRDIFSYIKESGVKYRIQLFDVVKNAVLSKTYKQKLISVH